MSSIDRPLHERKPYPSSHSSCEVRALLIDETIGEMSNMLEYKEGINCIWHAGERLNWLTKKKEQTLMVEAAAVAMIKYLTTVDW